MHRQRRNRTTRFGVLVLATCAVSRVAYAGDSAAAREQLKAGYLLAQDNNCEAAIPRFVESLKLDPKAITLINLADCEEKTGQLASALGHWVDARDRARGENNTGIVDEAEKRAKQLEPRLPRLTIALAADAPKDAEVVRDDVVLGSVSLGVSLPVNVGKHTVVVRAKGREDHVDRIQMAEGEHKDLVVHVGPPKAGSASGAAEEGGEGPKPNEVEEPRAESSRHGTSPLVYAGFGTAIVGVGVGAVTGILALGKASSVSSACPDHACRDEGALGDVDSGRTFGTVSTVAFIAAGVGAAVGVIGLLSSGKSGDAPSVALSVGPTGGALRGSF